MTGDPAVTSPDFSETVQLLRRAKAGEGDCLHQVLLRYRTRLLDRIRRLMGEEARRCADSDDQLQNVFVAVLADFEQFEMRDDQAFLRWITQIARNNIRDQVRRRHEAALMSFVSQSAELLGTSSPTPSNEAAQREQVDRLVDVLGELSPEQERVIQLRNFEGLSFAEISARTGRSENAAQLLHGRAVLELGRLLRSAR